MPQDSTGAVQAAVYSRLAVTSALTGLLATGAGSVRDHVPEDALFPYIVLGETAGRPHETQAGGGLELEMTLHIYSRGEGMKELKSIMTEVHTALHDADFSVTDQTLVLCRLLSSETFLENDGLTRHGVQRFRIITEPA